MVVERIGQHERRKLKYYTVHLQIRDTRIILILIQPKHSSSKMLKLILNRGLLLAAGFKIDKFQAKDYKAMCSLIKQKYPIYNQAIQIHKDIKLLDDNGKLIGRYSASEARKKASSMKKDIVLINQNSDPAICKAYNFRESILQKFYDEIVNKRNQQLLKKASTSKQLKISINLTESQMQIKSKQIIQLAKKNSKVRIFAVTKASQQQVALSKFDYLKSLIQNKCIIQRDIKVQDYKDDEQEQFEPKKKANEEPIKSYSIVIKSKQNQFMQLLNQSSQKDPDQAIQIFLQRYYRQEDVEMRDLRADASLRQSTDQISDIMDKMVQISKPKRKRSEKKSEKQTNKAGGDKQLGKQEKKQFTHKSDAMIEKQHQDWMREHSYVEKEAKARVLNERLKRILDTN